MCATARPSRRLPQPGKAPPPRSPSASISSRSASTPSTPQASSSLHSPTLRNLGIICACVHIRIPLSAHGRPFLPHPLPDRDVHDQSVLRLYARQGLLR